MIDLSEKNLGNVQANNVTCAEQSRLCQHPIKFTRLASGYGDVDGASKMQQLGAHVSKYSDLVDCVLGVDIFRRFSFGKCEQVACRAVSPCIGAMPAQHEG